MVAAPLVFRDASATRAITGGDWDYGRGKATCDDGEGIMGISLHLGDRQGHAALCRGNARQLTGPVVTSIFVPGGLRAQRLGDWSPGYYKFECGLGEFVRGVSENASFISGNNAFHGVLCARGTGLGSTCTARVFDGGEYPGDRSMGDWDYGYVKGACAAGEYLAGVSAHPADLHPRALLCCR